MLIAIAGLYIGFGGGGGGGGSSPTTPGAPNPLAGHPASPQRHHHGNSPEERLAAWLAAHPHRPPPGFVEGPTHNYISAAPVSDSSLARCRQEHHRGNESYLCRVLEAKAAGKLHPGWYTKAQLDRRIGVAG